METDLNGSDEHLDATLLVLYAKHTAASEAKDSAAQSDAHTAIMHIVREQRRRTDAWIEAKAL